MRIARLSAWPAFLFVAAMAAAGVARADDDACRIEPRLKRLPACQATLCAAGKTDHAFHTRLLKIDDTIDRLALMTDQAQDEHSLRLLVCKVLFLDPSTAPLRKKPTKDSSDLFMYAENEPSLIQSRNLADIVRDQDLFAPETDTIAATYGDKSCAAQIATAATKLVATTEAAMKQSDNFDTDTCTVLPDNSPKRQQSCADFISNYKSLYNPDDARQKLTECKTGCTEVFECRFARAAKIEMQNAARRLAAYKGRCAAQNPGFFAEAEKRAAEINAMSRDATANCR